jgi:exosortase
MIFFDHDIGAKSQAGMFGREKRTLIRPRDLLFVLFVVASLIGLWTPLKNLAILSQQSEEYSHTVLIPLMSLGLLYLERKKVFRETHYSFGLGALVLVGGITLACFGREYSAQLSQDSYLFLSITSLVILWMGGFVFCYGARAFCSGVFPLLFNLLMVPLPDSVMEKPIVLVQHGSAEVLSLFYELAGVPFFREGMTFSLTGLDLEVARQCSGIHSTVALFIASLVGGHFYLKSGRARFFLILSAFPTVSLTNGFRIFILSLLAVHVDSGFLRGNLHRRGGVLFFLAGLTILACLARLLRSRERAKQQSVNAPAGVTADRR